MYTGQQLQALRDAQANGVRRVRFADREIEYRSVDELKAAIAAAEADAAKASGTPLFSANGDAAELPYVFFVEQIRPGPGVVLDRMAVGCARQQQDHHRVRRLRAR